MSGRGKEFHCHGINWYHHPFRWSRCFVVFHWKLSLITFFLSPKTRTRIFWYLGKNRPTIWITYTWWIAGDAESGIGINFRKPSSDIKFVPYKIVLCGRFLFRSTDKDSMTLRIFWWRVWHKSLCKYDTISSSFGFILSSKVSSWTITILQQWYSISIQSWGGYSEIRKLLVSCKWCDTPPTVSWGVYIFGESFSSRSRWKHHLLCVDMMQKRRARTHAPAFHRSS